MADVVLRFVDAIAASRTVRMNLADFTIWRPQNDCRFDPPPVNRARASTMLTDGAFYSASKYEERTLSLHWLLQTSSSNQAADQIQTLNRELDRPAGNILEYQPPNMTHPVFFRTIRLAEEMQVVYPTDGTLYDIRAVVVAEPFAYGLREDPVSAATVNFDPAAASNAGFVDVTGVKGDVETPVKIVLGSASLAASSLFAVRRRGTPANTPFLLQAESMTVGTDTTTQANDAAFSGSSNNWTRTTFATAAMTTRLSMATFPASPSVDARGTYRVFGRMRKTVSGDSIQVKVTYGPGGILASEGTVTLAAGTGLVMVDFGLISIPAGQDPVVDMVTGTEIAAVGITISVSAGRTSGSGNLDIDYLLFVPADDRLAITNYGSFAPPTDWALDGVSEVIYGRDASGRVASVNTDASYIGGLPMLTPNQTNRVYFLYQVQSATTTVIGTTTPVSISYYPRYLAVRPAST